MQTGLSSVWVWCPHVWCPRRSSRDRKQPLLSHLQLHIQEVSLKIEVIVWGSDFRRPPEIWPPTTSGLSESTVAAWEHGNVNAAGRSCWHRNFHSQKNNGSFTSNCWLNWQTANPKAVFTFIRVECGPFWPSSGNVAAHSKDAASTGLKQRSTCGFSSEKLTGTNPDRN